MTRRVRRACALALAVLAGSLCAGAARASVPPASEPVVPIDGRAYVSGAALARLLAATRFWRADVRKLVLRSGTHRVVLTADNPFVLIDDRTVRLALPVRSKRGELFAPLALADSLPRDSTFARLVYEPRGMRLVVVPAGGVVGSPKIAAAGEAVRVSIACEHAEDAKVVGRARGNFRVRFDGFFAGVLPDSAPGGLVRAMRELPVAAGTALELTIAPDAAGWRLVRERDGIALEFVRRETPGFETFAPEGPPGPHTLRIVVLDPGHGGGDAGVTVADAVEKDLTLELAHALKPELERRLRVRVLLTRDADVAMDADTRAEAANRARADLVLALHFDGLPGSRAHGFTAYCPPAVAGAGAARPPGAPAPVEILPWRDIATRHAVRSREIAEAILSAVELRGEGPARLRETLTVPLLGVNAPGILLECATLTSPADLARLRSPNGMAELASAIAEGIESWERQP